MGDIFSALAVGVSLLSQPSTGELIYEHRRRERLREAEQLELKGQEVKRLAEAGQPPKSPAK